MPNHTSRQPSARVLFRQQMAQTFTESELRALCFDLEIDFEELGQGNKTDRIISLIGLTQRQGRLADLRVAVVDARPHLSWPTLEAVESSKDEERYEAETVPRKLTREEQLAQRNRQTMLLKVKAYWIDGVLANSLHSKVIPLDMERKPDAVTQPRPWDMLWQHRDHAPQPLPPGTRIIDRFNYAAGDALLILGEPGSGKTTMLLELAGELLEWAEQNETLRIPVVFNLSSWAVTRPLLTEWLVSELQTLYLIPKKVAQAWVEQDDILPLLDGLDEVVQEHRAACIKAVNSYREAQGTPLVVCSRIADYEAIGEKLLLSDALMLRPLTPEQINDYLVAGGPALEGVRAALQQDETLQGMAQSPLLLSIMVLAYREHLAEKIIPPDAGNRHQLFAIYIQQQLNRRKKDSAENTATTLHQLSYLAHQMTTYDQAIFLIERIQPTWLPDIKQRRRYEWATSLILGLYLGIVFELNNALIKGLSGIVIGLLLVKLYLSLGDVANAIRPVEKMIWTWSRTIILTGMGGGAAIGLAFGSLGMANYGLTGLLFFGLVGLLVGASIGVLFGGIVVKPLEIKTVPNEGIINSFQNSVWVALFLGICGTLGGGLVLGAFFELFFLVDHEFVTKIVLYGGKSGLILGLTLGILWGGATPVVQHFTLRFFLHCYGYLPFNLVPILDLAAERLILQKVGGGYRFVHRLLQEHLASLYIDEGGGK